MDESRIVLTTVYGRRILALICGDSIERIRVLSEADELPVGTVALGRVTKMIPSSNACFVTLADYKDYFFTIPANLNEISFADGKKHTSVHCEDVLLLQIDAEAVKLKQPSVTHKISIPGRFVVVEQGSGITYSKKISASDRKKISVSPYIRSNSDRYHYVFRTESAFADDSEGINSEACEITSVMDGIMNAVHISREKAVLYRPESEVTSLIKGWLKENPAEVITDESIYEKSIADAINSAANIRYTFYDDEDLPLYKMLRLETLIDRLINKKVYLKSGGFLVVEQGETLTAIDVNSAHAIKGSKEEAVFKLNMEAADEIAHVLRSRNISGMILVDFVNMKSKDMEHELMDHMKKILMKDEIRTSVVDITGLGLMEITRQRRFSSLMEQWKKRG